MVAIQGSTSVPRHCTPVVLPAQVAASVYGLPLGLMAWGDVQLSGGDACAGTAASANRATTATRILLDNPIPPQKDRCKCLLPRIELLQLRTVKTASTKWALLGSNQ